MEFGVYIESQEGVTWDDWKNIALRVEALGFDALVCSVHLQSLLAPGRWNLDPWTVLAGIALWTSRLRFGPMTLPVTFFTPTQIARASASLDRLSGGRFRLFLGAGRHAGEHEAFGVPYPDYNDRVTMLAEASDVIRLLWIGKSVSYQGRWYQLREAQLRPEPRVSRIGMSGNSPTSLRVVAAKADEWCTGGQPVEQLRALMKRLDEFAREAGRDPGAISRVMMNGFLVGRDLEELERRALRFATFSPALDGIPVNDVLKIARKEWQWWTGTPDELVEQVVPLIRTGLDAVYFQLLDLTDLDALHVLMEYVIPRLASSAE